MRQIRHKITEELDGFMLDRIKSVVERKYRAKVKKKIKFLLFMSRKKNKRKTKFSLPKVDPSLKMSSKVVKRRISSVSKKLTKRRVRRLMNHIFIKAVLKSTYYLGKVSPTLVRSYLENLNTKRNKLEILQIVNKVVTVESENQFLEKFATFYKKNLQRSKILKRSHKVTKRNLSV